MDEADKPLVRLSSIEVRHGAMRPTLGAAAATVAQKLKATREPEEAVFILYDLN